MILAFTSNKVIDQQSGNEEFDRRSTYSKSNLLHIYTALGKAMTGNDGHILDFASILFSFLKSDRHSKFQSVHRYSSGSQDIEYIYIYRWTNYDKLICILTWLRLHRKSWSAGQTWVAGITYLKRPRLEVPLRRAVHPEWSNPSPSVDPKKVTTISIQVSCYDVTMSSCLSVG